MKQVGAQTIWRCNDAVISGENPAIELLEMRGIEDPVDFLKITKKKLHNPYKMKDMKKAVQRITQAVKNGEKIRIYGDYDADGVSSTSLWVMILRELGADVSYFVPDRFKDGYGVNNKAITDCHKQGVQLIITCDTGITAIEQVQFAKSLGMDIIVTDHHEPQPVDAYDEALQKIGQVVHNATNEAYLIPDTIVVNPKRPDCKYPFKSLAGVGVSFKILCAVCEKIHPAGRAAAYAHMDIVALGTFADQMDVIDENRVIGKLGLKMMKKTKNRGLYQLIRANDLADKKLSSKDIGWTIAPCINAAGRIVSATDAVEMLISNNKLDAYRCAKKLVEINEERKKLTKKYVQSIIEAIESEQQDDPTAIIVHYHPGVPEGIIGLIAGRIANHFYKPAILLSDSEEPDIYKGSARSIKGFDMFGALMHQTSIMEGFGGHTMACGLSVHKDNFEQLRARLELYAETILSNEDLQRKVYIDCIIENGKILDIDFVKDIRRLEPFGNGNQRPTFMMRKLKVIREMPVGEEKNHLWALLSDGKTTFSTIGFWLYDKYVALGKPQKIDIAFFPNLNEYPKGSGKVSVQLELEDIRKAAK